MVERVDSLWEKTANLRMKDQGKVAKGRATHTFAVYGRKRSNPLGHVKWMAPWRQYVFFPLAGCAPLDPSDLTQLSFYCTFKTAEHKEKKTLTKAQQ